MIAKGSQNRLTCARRVVSYRSAREAFASILRAVEIGNGKVLLPAYVGWSAREGSGVFDPVEAAHLNYGFYRLNEGLRIDMDSLRAELRRGDIGVVVIIHYFGYVDPSYTDAVRLAKEHGAFVLEDEAHAMLSDIVGGACGRLGGACIFSFHKLLPVHIGGAAVINDPESSLARTLARDKKGTLPWHNFDLWSIAEKRRENSLLVDQLVRVIAPWIEPLFGQPSGGEVPQSYPVLVEAGIRDRLYHEMNASGFGVVSLYHTLILEISPTRFNGTSALSHRIMNLPVHQDATKEDLEKMVNELARRTYKR